MSLIAILDDRATNRHIFARLAESIEPDVTVHTFEEPVGALEWMADNVPDIVITDFKMPGFDGAEFTRRFRELPGCSDVPVVVITVYDERSFRLRALEAGATDFLHSPVDHSEFLTRARNLLKLRHQQEMLRNRASTLELELIHSEQSRKDALRDSHERLAQIVDTVPAMISATDIEGRCIFVNACHAKMHGMVGTEVAGKEAEHVYGKSRAERSRKLDRLVVETARILPGYEEAFVDPQGEERFLLTTKAPLRDHTGKIVSVLTTSLDISDRKRAERHLTHLAHHDALTNLPNRFLLTRRLREEIEAMSRGDSDFALHFLDLDRFKGINDVLGHAIGDKYLKVIADRLQSTIREDDVVARLGGDEFAILQSGIVRASDAAEFATRLIEVTSQPAVVDGNEIDATVSVGVTIAPDDGNDADELLKNADLAMYRAKADGGGTFRFCSSEMHTHAREISRLDAELRRAIEQEQFVLHFQPQIDVASGRIVGAETLLRWNRDGEIVHPGDFLARAEENGLIVPINEWVLREACREAHRWRKFVADPIRVAVNLSPLQFRRQNICDIVESALQDSGLDPWRLELEITENVVMENSEQILRDFTRLRRRGVRFSIDDFGTGYSSFKYIKSFPIDRLKIDQYFISNMVANPSDAAIVQAIIGLAKNLGLDVIGEGVETEEQLARLTEQGCDEVQGYFFSCPVPSDELVRLIRAQQDPVAMPA